MSKPLKIYKNLEDLPTPCFVCYEQILENNLKILKKIEDKSKAKILLAFKGFALPASFELCKKYLSGTSASGLNESILAKKFGKEVHTYSPAFKDEEFSEVLQNSNKVIFNSFSQWKKYKNQALEKVSCGLRINPQFSSVEVDLYNPCARYSRLGITKAEFDDNDLEGIEGFHFHALCEQNLDALKKVLDKFEQNFSQYFKDLKWLNFGGGHHITRVDYDVAGLITLLKNFKSRYPNLQIYLEPSEAVAWQSGILLTKVLDLIKNEKNIAILDTSVETHLPDILAMPYRAKIKNEILKTNKSHDYILGGISCLAGDFLGEYSFEDKLKIGQKLILEDMIHYTFVKTTTFNGINLPSLVYARITGDFEVIRDFGFDDYMMRLS